MKKFSLFSRVVTISILSIAVVACGGGGDVAGDTEEFFTNPDEWKVASLGCGGGASRTTEIEITVEEPEETVQ